MYLISLKSFCTGRATLKERKRQPSEWENKLLQLKLETRHSSPKTQSAHTVKVKLAQLCPTLCDPWTVQPMHFSRPEYWSEPPFSSPGDLPNPGIETRSPALQVDSSPAEPPGKPLQLMIKKRISPGEKLAKI